MFFHAKQAQGQGGSRFLSPYINGDRESVIPTESLSRVRWRIKPIYGGIIYLSDTIFKFETRRI